ncbi:MAG TPA: hypothetical protein DDW52_00415 [Planctomycetaceae bacterium]|nr:hypothetical protein [Planctomycetaceae bacterium]
MPLRKLFFVTLLFVTLNGCSSRNPDWKETIPVTGVIHVDGEPAEGIHIKFHPKEGVDTDQTTETKAISDAEGKFTASTYELNDGAPVGEYTLTFEWLKLNPVSMQFGDDQLRGKYSKPDKSEHSVTVASGTPVDIGTIELKGKK